MDFSSIYYFRKTVRTINLEASKNAKCIYKQQFKVITLYVFTLLCAMKFASSLGDAETVIPMKKSATTALQTILSIQRIPHSLNSPNKRALFVKGPVQIHRSEPKYTSQIRV